MEREREISGSAGSSSAATRLRRPAPVYRYARWLRDAQPGAVPPPPSCLGAIGAGESIGIALLLRDAEAAGFVAIEDGAPFGLRAVRTAAPLPAPWNPDAASIDAFERALPLLPGGAQVGALRRGQVAA